MTSTFPSSARWVLICVLAAGWAYSAGDSAAVLAQTSTFEEFTLPLEMQPIYLFKATAYDLNRNRYGEGYRIGIIFSPNDKSSMGAREIAQYFPKLNNNRPVHGFQFPFTNAAQLRDDILSNRINILYICPGNDRNLITIVDIARQLRVLTVTGIEKYVRGGVALGLHGYGNGNSIKANYSVNTLASTFDASFLYTVRRKYP